MFLKLCYVPKLHVPEALAAISIKQMFPESYVVCTAASAMFLSATAGFTVTIITGKIEAFSLHG